MKAYTLEQEVFSYILAKKHLETFEILDHFKDKNYTKQGVYKVLRKLHAEGKILWVKTHVEAHLMWIHQEIEHLASVLPRKEIIFQEFGKKKKTYYAKTLTELEQVYGQIFISLISSVQEEVRDYLFYDVHNYTYVNTVPIVDWYIDFITKNKGMTYLLVGSVSPLDLLLKKKNKMKTIQVHCIEKKWSANLSIFGDYVISVTTNKKILDKMEIIFQTKNEEDARVPLRAIYDEKSLHKIVVEKNEEKADEIRKEFKKYFVLRTK